jgi:hypothetical protein
MNVPFGVCRGPIAQIQSFPWAGPGEDMRVTIWSFQYVARDFIMPS